MEKIMAFAAENPLTALLVCFITLLILYFLLKQFVKLALILVIILLAVVGYYYFKDPQQMPQNMMNTVKDVKEKTSAATDKMKEMYLKGKYFFEKGKEIVQDREKP